MKNKKQTKVIFPKINNIKRLKLAKLSYEKMMKEVMPFVPKYVTKEINTAGKWGSASNFSY